MSTDIQKLLLSTN